MAIFPGVRAIHDPAYPELPHVALALDPLRLLLGLGQRRQEQRRQNGDDGDDHQEFNECKAARTITPPTISETLEVHDRIRVFLLYSSLRGSRTGFERRQCDRVMNRHPTRTGASVDM
jgi:hypothetical protein